MGSFSFVLFWCWGNSTTRTPQNSLDTNHGSKNHEKTSPFRCCLTQSSCQGGEKITTLLNHTMKLKHWWMKAGILWISSEPWNNSWWLKSTTNPKLKNMQQTKMEKNLPKDWMKILSKYLSGSYHLVFCWNTSCLLMINDFYWTSAATHHFFPTPGTPPPNPFTKHRCCKPSIVMITTQWC